MHKKKIIKPMMIMIKPIFQIPKYFLSSYDGLIFQHRKAGTKETEIDWQSDLLYHYICGQQ